CMRAPIEAATTFDYW
nr:immunoglobulin heavy chain junction region [Macaca mulatta]MOW98695.1 immunoglobulin heavy chain junction region [Macaca mulatta]MOW98721.1 immunoglobulin heavy chain junction region [Macaca mulatta]MOW99783.1 immunoglobulin heavy chain junction region [Macaca mulatta]MOX00196.1 immunoglobulin heavy chain junction region [Macaca mulatta]